MTLKLELPVFKPKGTQREIKDELRRQDQTYPFAHRLSPSDYIDKSYGLRVSHIMAALTGCSIVHAEKDMAALEKWTPWVMDRFMGYSTLVSKMLETEGVPLGRIPRISGLIMQLEGPAYLEEIGLAIKTLPLGERIGWETLVRLGALLDMAVKNPWVGVHANELELGADWTVMKYAERDALFDEMGRIWNRTMNAEAK